MYKKAHSKFICIIVIFAIVMLYPAGCSKTPQNQSPGNEQVKPPELHPIKGFAVFENLDAGIRIQYPENWDIKEGDNGVAFLIPKENTGTVLYEGFNLLYEKMYGIEMSLEKYLEITIDGMKKYMPGFTLIESSESTLGGHPACRIIYLGTHESMEMKFFSMFAIRKGFVYALSFNTLSDQFDAYRETYEKITGSFQFLN
ncbi:MAG: hypothetical protein JXB88_00855 [Spirochaetales bacterium]|nr:hypothetical protein [Spirochaetales bacterium]